MTHWAQSNPRSGLTFLQRILTVALMDGVRYGDEEEFRRRSSVSEDYPITREDWDVADSLRRVYCQSLLDLHPLEDLLTAWARANASRAMTPPPREELPVHGPAERLDPRRCFTRHQRTKILERSDGTCYHCGEPLDQTWEADHLVPWSQGGRTDLDNAVASCRDCNRAKSDKMPAEPGN